MSLFRDSLDMMQRRDRERANLLTQLDRQMRFFTEFGIHAHEIQNIRVRARGCDNVQSWVTMKDGTEHNIKGVDVKFVLDGKAVWPKR